MYDGDEEEMRGDTHGATLLAPSPVRLHRDDTMATSSMATASDGIRAIVTPTTRPSQPCHAEFRQESRAKTARKTSYPRADGDDDVRTQRLISADCSPGLGLRY